MCLDKLADGYRINQPMNTAETMKERLERLGFVDVRDDIYKVGPRIEQWKPSI